MTDKDFLISDGFSRISPNKWADKTNGNPESKRYKQTIPSNVKRYWMPGKPFRGTHPKNGTKFSSDQIESQEFLYYDIDNKTVREQIENPPNLGNIKPHILVWTGNKSIHPYFRIENTKDLVKWRNTQKLLIKLTNGDKLIHNPDRIMSHPGYKNPITGEYPLVKFFDHPTYTLDYIFDELKKTLFLEKLTDFPYGKPGSGTYDQQRVFVWKLLKWSEENNFDLSTTKKELGKLLEQNERELSAIKDYDPKKIKLSEDEIIEDDPIPTFELEKPKDPNSIDLDYDILPPYIISLLDTLLFSLRQSKMTTTLLFLGTILSSMRYCVIDNQYGNKQPNSLWVGLVGRSGIGKTPLLNEIFRNPIEDIGKKIKDMKFPSHVKNDIKNDAGWNSFPKPPIHVISADATMQGVIKYVYSAQQYPRNNNRLISSVLEGTQQQLPYVLFDDELSGFLGGQGRFLKSSERANLSTLIKLFDGKKCSVIRSDDTKSVEIEDFCFNLIGGIQPDVIKNLKKTVDLNIGLFPRILFTPCRKNKVKHRPDKTEFNGAQNELKSVCNKAFDLKTKYYYLDDSSIDFIEELENDELNEFASDIETQLRGKRVSHIMRLSLAIHVLDIIGNDLPFTDTVSLDTVKKAHHLYEKLYEYNVLLHQDRTMTGDVKDQLYYEFREWILGEFPDGDKIPRGELKKRFNKSRDFRQLKYDNDDDFNDAINKLHNDKIINKNYRKNNVRKILVHRLGGN